MALKKDDFSIESEMMRRSRDLDLRMAEVRIQCRYGNFDTSAKNPVSHGFGVRGIGDPDHRREETAAAYRGTRVHYVSCRGLLRDTAASLQVYNQTRFFSLAYAMLVSIFLIPGAIGVFMGLMLNVISRLRVGEREGGRG